MKRVLVGTEGGEGVVVGCALHTQCTCCKSMMRCFYFELVILFFGLVFQLVFHRAGTDWFENSKFDLRETIQTDAGGSERK